jgi:hypothetical protein
VPHILVSVYQNCGGTQLSTSVFTVEVATVLSCAANIKLHSFWSSAIWVTNQLCIPLMTFVTHGRWQQGCTVRIDKVYILYHVQQLPQKYVSHRKPALTASLYLLTRWIIVLESVELVYSKNIVTILLSTHWLYIRESICMICRGDFYNTDAWYFDCLPSHLKPYLTCFCSLFLSGIGPVIWNLSIVLYMVFYVAQVMWDIVQKLKWRFLLAHTASNGHSLYNWICSKCIHYRCGLTSQYPVKLFGYLQQ